MKLNTFTILTFIAALLTSCNFFNSTVPYKGTEEDPQLVVNALVNPKDTPKIYVSRSFFFMDKERYNRQPAGSTRPGVYQNHGVHNGNLNDASVSLTINHQAPTDLQYLCIRKDSAYVDEMGYYTTGALTILPGDTVGLLASHPIYGTVSAAQICPDSISIRLLSVKMTNYAEAKIRLHFAPYHGNHDDVIYISGDMNLTGRYSFKSGNITYGYTITNHPHNTYLYSYDNRFIDLNTYQSDYGYYAGKYLLLPASAIKEGLDIDLIADIHAITTVNGQDFKCKLDMVQLSLMASACTNDYYMYTQSLLADKGIDLSYTPKLSSVTAVDNEAGDMMEDITDIFSELGGQEGIQIQCNIHGGLGHFCLSTSDTCYYEKIGH